MILFTFAMFELAGAVVEALLWSALTPLAILAGLAGGSFLLYRKRRR